ncbi:tetratricopeptide repeat protein [Rhodovulum sp. DZ06]|uniref:tetratricopeptide repeat protein n=1 Tax=Rhodovulum sp. DZ06 TaxID=3425126 RepID=UPI003D33F2D0
MIPPPGAPTPPEMLAPLPPDAPGTESPAGAVAGDLAPERGEAPTKKQRLDGLFEELAALGPDEEGARRRVAGEIGRLWSLSGSDTIDLLLRRGREAMEDGDNHRALAHFSALTDHAPGFAEGWNARATAFFLLEEWGMALADIERALELEPRHFGALTGLGVILEKIDRPQDALRAWRRALEVHPHLERAVEAVERLSVEVEGRDI